MGDAAGGGEPGGTPWVDASGLDPLSPSKGDFVDPCLGDLISILRLPGWLKGLLAFMMKPLVRAQGMEGWAPLGSFPLPLASFSSQPLPYLFSSPHALQSSANLRAERSAYLGPAGRDRGRRPRWLGLKIIATPGLKSSH